MKQGDKVTTPDGLGIIIGIDLPESRAMRYVVRLDVSKYTFNPAYFPEEIRKASQKAAMWRSPRSGSDEACNFSHAQCRMTRKIF